MPHIRDMTYDDLAAVFSINQAATPAVGSLNQPDLRQLFEWCAHRLVISVQEQIVGFLLAMEPGTPYQSLNYQFFEGLGQDHVYLDRIAIDAAYRNQRLGQMLYQELFKQVAARPVTCEVNLIPPNPGSMRFHSRIGFVIVGEQSTEGGKKRVALLRRDGQI